MQFNVLRLRHARRTDKQPIVSDLRESGSLEQDADMVILLHRPDALDRDNHCGAPASPVQIRGHGAGLGLTALGRVFSL